MENHVDKHLVIFYIAFMFTTIIENRKYELSGPGASNWSKDEGKFLVRHGTTWKSFDVLLSAFAYFIRLDESADLLDVTGDTQQLVEKRMITYL